MVRCLRTSGVTSRIEMHTNASLLTAEMAKEIARAGFSRIIVSLQGMDASTYQRVCGVRLDWDDFYTLFDKIADTVSVEEVTPLWNLV